MSVEDNTMQKIKKKITKHNLNYKESHEEQIKERGTKKCLCGCGKEYNQWNKSAHQKTIFHQNWLKEARSHQNIIF